MKVTVPSTSVFSAAVICFLPGKQTLTVSIQCCWLLSLRSVNPAFGAMSSVVLNTAFSYSGTHTLLLYHCSLFACFCVLMCEEGRQ